MLKEIAIVTLTVASPAEVEQAWHEYFDYRTVDTGTVSRELADLWQAPAMTGEQYILLQPEQRGGSRGDETAESYIRLVSAAEAEAYRPMTSHGWNATELLVSDTDRVAEKLADSPFAVIGAPRPLWDAPDAPRVMQVLGPGQELLYLTTNLNAMRSLGLDDTMPLVERPFIVVAGGASMSDFRAFYGDLLGLGVSEPSPFRITMISKANGLPLDTTYPLSVVNLSPGYLIEVDELPADIGPRVVRPGRLPSGVAVVSFTADVPANGLFWLRQPRPLQEFPYNGRAAGLLRGPAGELIEVILPVALSPDGS